MTLADPIPITRRQEFLENVLRRTGYGFPDILSVSFITHIVLMRNGGKYQMLNGKLEHLAGPSPDASERM